LADSRSRFSNYPLDARGAGPDTPPIACDILNCRLEFRAIVGAYIFEFVCQVLSGREPLLSAGVSGPLRAAWFMKFYPTYWTLIALGSLSH
jgi:hypothetical protein